jgi:hypothetical protein
MHVQATFLRRTREKICTTKGMAASQPAGRPPATCSAEGNRYFHWFRICLYFSIFLLAQALME